MSNTNDGTLDPSENYAQQGSESTKLDDYFLTQIGVHLKTGEWDMEPTEMVANWSAKLLEWSRQEADKKLNAVYDQLQIPEVKEIIEELQGGKNARS